MRFKRFPNWWKQALLSRVKINPGWLISKSFKKPQVRFSKFYFIVAVKHFQFAVKMVTVMLVTSLYWWLNDGDWFEMLVAESVCWRLFTLSWWFCQHLESVTNILNQSPTSQICHQHIWSPTSVTNIDVTVKIVESDKQIFSLR